MYVTKYFRTINEATTALNELDVKPKDVLFFNKVHDEWCLIYYKNER